MPNPVYDVMTISFETWVNSTLVTLSLTNIMGKEIFSSILKKQKTSMELKGISNGIYFVQVKSEQGIIKRKIIVAR